MFNLLKENLKKLVDEKTYYHSIRVMEVAMVLGEIHGGDIEKIRIAAILHDCRKNYKDIYLLKKGHEFDTILDEYMEYNKELIHGPLGANLAKEEFNIGDAEILDAIRYHTTGRKDMSIIEKIIYISDYIEPSRDFKGIEEVRKLAFTDLDLSLILAMDKTIKFLIDKDMIIHPYTINARNYLMMKLHI